MLSPIRRKQKSARRPQPAVATPLAAPASPWFGLTARRDRTPATSRGMACRIQCRRPGGDHEKGAATVIARIWRGWTTPEKADAYQRIVSQEALPSIAARGLDGYHGAYLLRRDLDG